MHAEKSNFTIARMARLLGVSRSGYQEVSPTPLSCASRWVNAPCVTTERIDRR